MLMLISAALIATAAQATGCTTQVVRASVKERLDDAILVTLSIRHAVRPGDVGTVMAMDGVRIVRARLAGVEPAAFIFEDGTSVKVLGVWWDGHGSRQSAYAWARRKLRLPADIATCFARESVAPD